MVKKILSTLFFKALLAGLSFLLAVVVSRYLGPAGKGDVSLFVLNLTVVQLISNFIGGTFIVYLVPRKNLMHLLLISYAWAAASSAVIPMVLLLGGLLEQAQFLPLAVISLLYSFFSVNLMIFIGKEETGKYNLVSFFQVLVLLSVFVVFVKSYSDYSLDAYIRALFISSGLAFAASFLLLIQWFGKFTPEGISATFKEAFKGGFLLQVANTAQLLSYRLSFYLLDHFSAEGRREVGIYSVAVSISEALWLISNSVSLVLYGRIVNKDDIAYSRRVTLTLIKIVVLATLLATGILLCLPGSFFVIVFGSGFENVVDALFPLSAGIVVLSAGMVLSVYFVGNGRPGVSVVASSVGLIVTIVLGFALIPMYGMKGAAVTASVSYASGVLYQLWEFIKEKDDIRLKDFRITRNDVDLTMKEMSAIFGKNQAR